MKKLLIGILIGMALRAGVVFAFHSIDHILEQQNQDFKDRRREQNEQNRHNETMFELRKKHDC